MGHNTYLLTSANVAPLWLLKHGCNFRITHCFQLGCASLNSYRLQWTPKIKRCKEQQMILTAFLEVAVLHPV